MDVLSIGTLRLDTLPKPGRGWEDTVEGLTLGVKDDAWLAESLRSHGSLTLMALLDGELSKLAPSKLCTLLQPENLQERSVSAYASVEHIFELVLTETWVPKLEHLLVAPYKVVGQVMPRWRLRFMWDLPAAPYHMKEMHFDFAQVNAVKATRVK